MYLLLSMMKKITNNECKMWGDSIMGFDQYHYVYRSGREGEMFLTGCSPRKNIYQSLLLQDLINIKIN